MRECALISIYPEHAFNILAGKKAFEYRKVTPRRSLSHLVLYCTIPVRKIVAIAEVVNCLIGSRSYVWSMTAHGSGISQQVFYDYFSHRRDAITFKIGNVYAISTPIELSELKRNKTPPQSFYYLDDSDIELILRRAGTSVV